MIVRETVFRDLLRLVIWFPIRWLVGILPVSGSLWLFKLLGDIHYSLGGGKRKLLEDNLDRLLKPERNERDLTVRRYLEIHYLDRLHIFLYPKFNKRNITRYVKVEGIENLEAALKKGKGCILIQPHFGPVQISLLTLSLLGFDLVQVGYPSDDGLSYIGKKVAYKYRLRYEGMLPAPIYSADRYVGVIFRHLKKNGVVMTTGDGAGGGKMLGKHLEMDFLGTRRMIPVGPASLSLRTGSSLLPTFIRVDKFNRLSLKIEPAVTVEGSGGDRLEREKLLTEKFLRVAEQYIRKYPHNYHFWDELLERSV